MKNNKKIIGILIVALSIALITSVIWITTSSLTAPDKEKTEKCFQKDKDNLSIVADYLSSLDYSYISIDKDNIKDGVMFTGADTRYQDIDDKVVVEALRVLLNDRDYIVVGKNEETVFFEKWRFLEKDRGIAVTVDTEDAPEVEFIVRYEALSETGWYYYEADYEEYRN